MARERITFPVNLRQNTNDDSTAFGKWFPVPSTSEPMSLKGFAKHLSAPLRARQARLLRYARAGAPEHRELYEGTHPSGSVGEA